MQALVKEHKAAFEGMRAYYSDIVSSLLNIVKALKMDSAELKRREIAAESLAHELAVENKNLKEPLQLVGCLRVL